MTWIDRMRGVTRRLFCGSVALGRSLDLRRWNRAQYRFLRIEALLLLVAMPIVAYGMHVASERYWIGRDPNEFNCMPWSWVVVERIAAPEQHRWQRGQMVVVRAEGLRPFVNDGSPLGKVLVGLPGDTIRVTIDGIFVNEAVVPVGHLHVDAVERADTKVGVPAGLSRRPLKSFYRTIVLGKGEVFLMGVTPLSQDSRYFGPQKVANLRGVVLAALG